MRDTHQQIEHRGENFEQRLNEKIHQLELATVESVFGTNMGSPTFDFQVGGRQAIEKLISWMRSFSGSPNRLPLLELPWKQLLEIQQFESRLPQNPTEADLMNAILTRNPEWVRNISSFGEMGKRLAEWMSEDQEAFITMQKTLESYQAFSQNLISETDEFFQPGKSPAHQYVSDTLKHAPDERTAYQVRYVAKQKNKQLTQPARAIYWQKIEEAVARHDRETLKHLSQEMRDQTTIFNKIFSAAVRSEYKIGIEDIKDVEVEEQNVASLTPKDAGDIKRIITENWTSHPDLIPDMVDSLHTHKSSSTFYLLKKNGQVIAFLRAGDYKNKNEKGLWLGMLNVDSHYKGHAVATAFTKEMITMLGEDQTLFADVFPTIDAGMMYVERLGFQIVGISDPMKTGNPVQQRLLLKRRMAGDETANHVTRTQREAFRIPEDAALMIHIVDKLTDEGKVGTRYETDLTDPKVRWITFSTLAKKGNQSEVDLKRAA